MCDKIEESIDKRSRHTGHALYLVYGVNLVLYLASIYVIFADGLYKQMTVVPNIPDDITKPLLYFFFLVNSMLIVSVLKVKKKLSMERFLFLSFIPWVVVFSLFTFHIVPRPESVLVYLQSGLTLILLGQMIVYRAIQLHALTSFVASASIGILITLFHYAIFFPAMNSIDAKRQEIVTMALRVPVHSPFLDFYCSKYYGITTHTPNPGSYINDKFLCLNKENISQAKNKTLIKAMPSIDNFFKTAPDNSSTVYEYKGSANPSDRIFIGLRKPDGAIFISTAEQMIQERIMADKQMYLLSTLGAISWYIFLLTAWLFHDLFIFKRNQPKTSIYSTN